MHNSTSILSRCERSHAICLWQLENVCMVHYVAALAAPINVGILLESEVAQER